MIDAIGYIGMVLVATSFIFRNIWRFRIFNSIGCAVCIVYGIVSRTPPTAILNVVILTINIITIMKLKKEK